MNNIKKVLSAWMLVACVLPVAAQYPVIPDSVKARGAKQEAEFERKSDAAWEKALPTVLEEAKKGRPYKPWASKPEDLIKSNIPAFPGAEGGGMYTPGGRGGKVIVVTSLEDSGPGTLREACETGGARIIVFNVAGVIRLKSPISVRAPYVTIAGQTAPGDGICVTGQSFLIDTHDVVIRHMRFRRGAQDVAFRDDAVGGNAVGNIMVDGLGVGDVGNIVLRDRQRLAEDGIIIVVMTLESGSGQVLAGPDIVSRGFVYVRNSESLMDEAKTVLDRTMESCMDHNITDWGKIKNEVKDALGDFVWKETKRRPMIMPIIMEV